MTALEGELGVALCVGRSSCVSTSTTSVLPVGTLSLESSSSSYDNQKGACNGNAFNFTGWSYRWRCSIQVDMTQNDAGRKVRLKADNSCTIGTYMQSRIVPVHNGMLRVNGRKRSVQVPEY